MNMDKDKGIDHHKNYISVMRKIMYNTFYRVYKVL